MEPDPRALGGHQSPQSPTNYSIKPRDPRQMVKLDPIHTNFFYSARLNKYNVKLKEIQL